MKAVEESNKFKRLIRESVYPILQKVETLQDAQQVCEIVKTISLSKMQGYWADKTFKDLGLAEELTKDTKAKDRDIYAELFEAVNDLPVADSMKLFEGMERVLGGYAQKFASEKKMADLAVSEIINEEVEAK